MSPASDRLASARPIHLLEEQATPLKHVETIPLILPQPPRLSQHLSGLEEIEASGIYSNYGPVNTKLEQELIQNVFLEGSCVTVCNATIGLMLAIREVIGEDRPAHRRYALMPSFTFAATAQAALWCGLTPLFCDIDPETWLPSEQSEVALLHEYAGQIAVVVPYATFGNNLDLGRYQRMAEQHDVPIVVDAAASLGSLDEAGRAFGAGFAWPVVFSMHATKAFSVGEGGFIYCADEDRIGRLRSMGGFGFSHGRSASSIGLNSKMSEVAALTAHIQLQHYGGIVLQRQEVAAVYAHELQAEFVLQQQRGVRQVHSFQSVLLPAELAPVRSKVLEIMIASGVGAGCYFSPHLAEQPYFLKTARSGPLPNTAAIASRVISLPLRMGMTREQVSYVVAKLRKLIEHPAASAPSLSRQLTPTLTAPVLPGSVRAA